MASSVVFRVARGLQEAGLAVVRFNFRGVGESEGAPTGPGSLEDPSGEVDDLRAVLQWLGGEHPGLELWAGGYSFGARVAARVATHAAEGDERVCRTLLVAPPVRVTPLDDLARLACPGLVLMAGEDDFGTQADIQAQFPDLPRSLELDELPDTDHSFQGALAALQQRVRDWATRSVSQRVHEESGPPPQETGP